MSIRRALQFLLIALLIASISSSYSTSAFAAPELDPTTPLGRAFLGTAKVASPYGTGTAWAWRVDYLRDRIYWLTCAHVVCGQVDPQTRVVEVDGARAVATVLKMDRLRDLALLQSARFPGVLPLPLSDELPGLGVEVAAPGAPHGDPGWVHFGHVAAPFPIVPYGLSTVPSLRLAIDAYPGMSGGPVIRLDNGRVVGMIQAIFTPNGERTDCTIAVTCESIRGFVEGRDAP